MTLPNGAFLRALSTATYDLSLFGHRRLAQELWGLVELHKLGADRTCLSCDVPYPCQTLQHVSAGLNVSWSTLLRLSTEEDEI